MSREGFGYSEKRYFGSPIYISCFPTEGFVCTRKSTEGRLVRGGRSASLLAPPLRSGSANGFRRIRHRTVAQSAGAAAISSCSLALAHQLPKCAQTADHAGPQKIACSHILTRAHAFPIPT